MGITIKKVGDLFWGEADYPNSNTYWVSEQPMPLDDLIQGLLQAGCHQTDIGDQLYMLDPNWLDWDKKK